MDNTPGIEIAQKATSLVGNASGPLIALAVTLLLLTLSVLVVAFVINRTPRE